MFMHLGVNNDNESSFSYLAGNDICIHIIRSLFLMLVIIIAAIAIKSSNDLKRFAMYFANWGLIINFIVFLANSLRDFFNNI